MNFNELMQRMAELDQPAEQPVNEGVMNLKDVIKFSMMPGLNEEEFYDELYSHIDSYAGKEAADSLFRSTDHVKHLYDYYVEVTGNDGYEEESVTEQNVTEGMFDEVNYYITNHIEPGLDRDEFLDKVFAYIDAEYGQRASVEMEHYQDDLWDEYQASASEWGESVTEDTLDECGMGPMPMNQQQDSVSMNVSMNGSGKGGIRDLIDVLKNLEDGGTDMGHDDFHSHGDDDRDMLMPKKHDLIDDDLANSPNPMAVTAPPGDDLHSKGGEAPKVNGGGNPMNLESTLRTELDKLYQTIKEDAEVEEAYYTRGSGRNFYGSRGRKSDYRSKSEYNPYEMPPEYRGDNKDRKDAPSSEKEFKDRERNAGVDETIYTRGSGRNFYGSRGKKSDYTPRGYGYGSDSIQRRDRNFGVEQEKNNVAIEINGKVWKVIPGEAENPVRALARGRSMAATIERNAEAKGRKVKVDVYVTGASATTEDVKVTQLPAGPAPKGSWGKGLSRPKFDKGDAPRRSADRDDYTDRRMRDAENRGTGDNERARRSMRGED